MSRSLEGLRDWVRRSASPPPPSREAVTLVAGGKGGVGTSTLAGLLALVRASGGPGPAGVEGGSAPSPSRVLLVEGGPGGLPLLFGLEGEVAGIADLARGGIEVADLLRPVAPGVDLLPAGGWGIDQGIGGGERALLLRRALDLYPAYDHVVVDAGSRADSVLAAAEPGYGELLVVTQRDRVSAAGAYALIKAVHARRPELPLRLLVNRATPSEGAAVAGVVAEAARHFLALALSAAPTIPSDPALLAALTEGRSLAEVAPGSAWKALGTGGAGPGEGRGSVARQVRPAPGRATLPGAPFTSGPMDPAAGGLR